MSRSRGTRVIQEWITGQRSKLSLVTSGLRIFFSIMEVVKEFVVKGYADADFDTNLDDSEQLTGFV